MRQFICIDPCMVLEGLGQGRRGEFWIVDAESGDVAVKANCFPFMVGPGLRVEQPDGKPAEGFLIPPRERVPKRPGFLSAANVFETEPGTDPLIDSLPSFLRPQALFGLGQAGRMFWEVLGPGAFPIASFRCRPFWVAPGLAVKQVDQRAAEETLIVRGAAEFPEGTVRVRRGPLQTHMRGLDDAASAPASEVAALLVFIGVGATIGAIFGAIRDDDTARGVTLGAIGGAAAGAIRILVRKLQ